MKSMFTKGLGIGLGIGLSIYLTGLLLDSKEKFSKVSERDTFGTGN
ncbi:hypothetical protein RJD24_12030 [Bacillaceae bacterium IKA-2]|nr:hypothetical protein RJD24_12030 [Bacillaceae bacterium IKA-2]